MDYANDDDAKKEMDVLNYTDRCSQAVSAKDSGATPSWGAANRSTSWSQSPKPLTLTGSHVTPGLVIQGECHCERRNVSNREGTVARRKARRIYGRGLLVP